MKKLKNPSNCAERPLWGIVLCRSGLRATHSMAHHCLGPSSQLLTFHFLYSHFPRERIQLGHHPTQKTLWDRAFGQATSKEPDLWLGHQSTGQSCATKGAELTAQVVTTVKELPMTSVRWSLEHHRSPCSIQLRESVLRYTFHQSRNPTHPHLTGCEALGSSLNLFPHLYDGDSDIYLCES